jgi:hypothetical protein
MKLKIYQNLTRRFYYNSYENDCIFIIIIFYKQFNKVYDEITKTIDNFLQL